MKKSIYLFLAKIALRLHTFAYKMASKFSILAEGGLHPKHRLMNYHQFFLNNIKEGDKILDIGCGNGSLAYDLASKASKVVAIDIENEKVDEAKKRYKVSNVEYIVGDATSYNFDSDFDIVILSNVLEHIEDRIPFLRSIQNLADKFLIRVPMIDREWIVYYKKELGLEWRLDYTHFTEYTIKQLESELEQTDLKIHDLSVQFGEIWAIVIRK